MHLLIGLAGILLILAIAFALSSNRRAIRLRVVGAAFLLQAGIALLVLYVPAGRAIIAGMSHGVANLLGYAQAGTNFIFGPLAKPEIGGASFAIAALPVIIFFASLVSILYYPGMGSPGVVSAFSTAATAAARRVSGRWISSSSGSSGSHSGSSGIMILAISRPPGAAMKLAASR